MSQDIDDLINILKNNSTWESRRDTAKALSNIKEARVVDALIDALNSDSNWVVRYHAAEALGNLGDDRAIPHLSKGLYQSDQSIQEHSAKALAKFGFKGIEALSAALKSQNGVLRSFVIDAMGAAKNPEFMPLLLESLRDSENWVAVSAVRAVGELGNPAAGDPLLDLLKTNNDPKFVETVKQSLNKLGIDASETIIIAERKAAEAFLSGLKALRVGMSESELETLVGSGVFQTGTRRVYKNQYGEFQLDISGGRVVGIPESMGPAWLIKKLEADLFPFQPVSQDDPNVNNDPVANRRWWEFWR